MFWINLISSLRYFLRHKLHTLINILGLAIGLATCILIFLFVQDELSYDRFHDNAKNIYRLEPHFVGQGEDSHWAASDGLLIPQISAKFPEIEASVKMHFSYMSTIFRYQDKFFREEQMFVADSAFFEVFSFDLIEGDKKKALSGGEKIILTESTAKKYFGDEDPMGKIITANNTSFIVSGIVNDPPENSHFHFNMIIPMDDLRRRWGGVDQAGASAFYSYVKLHDRESMKALKEKANNEIWEIFGYTTTGDSANIPEGYTAEIIFNPVTDIHLHGHAEKEIETNSDIQYIYIFSTVAFFILIIACINYMNLSTARSTGRSREIGVKKVMGAGKRYIFNQFMGESYIMCLIALILAMAAVSSILPWFNTFSGKHLTMNLLHNPELIALLIIIWIVVGFLSGSYPAVYLSRFNPLKMLYSNTLSQGNGKGPLYFRRGLVLFQFSLSVLLIIGMFTVYRQLHFIENKTLGFEKGDVVIIPLPGITEQEKKESFKNELYQIPEVISASASSVIPGQRVHVLPIRFPDIAEENIEQNDEGDDAVSIRVLSADLDAAKTFGLHIVQGRAFSKDYNDEEEGFLINEAAVKEFEMENPVGARVEYLWNLEVPKKGHIIGVVKDFNYASLHNEVEPLLIHVFPLYDRYISVKVNTSDTPGLIRKLEEAWQNAFPASPFDYFFLDTFYDNMYRSEMNMGRIITYFTFLAIFIACLGLLGLASYITEQRTKEIGIRKVLGASNPVIVMLLSKELLVIIAIANLIAWIPAWFIMTGWLDGFKYRVSVSWWVFIVSGLLSILIALLIVGFQAYRAAVKNPVEALKYE